MKLNEKGFGFTTFIVFIFVFLIAIIIIAVLTNSTDLSPDNGGQSKSDREEAIIYGNYEKNIIDSARQYYDDNDLEVIDGDSIIISIKKLQLSNKITDSCSGYVRITNENDSIIYSPYINCGNYETDSYIPSLDK